ncbi:excinuclease ABC subunit UvrC [Campylobacter sp. RM12647]|uniref:excinuclease ABC subunit UvrC n=1 Tax=Campylobacter sp. RM12647 TaxID=2735737 RepID=UPI001D9B0505|nr:excinuclease ABC subunit C [Campylobacter sp. RM12647]
MQKSNLLDKIKSLPNSSGVYRYYHNNTLLYVGKAKDLKKRVKSYFAFTPSLRANPKNSPRIIKLIEEANNLEYTATNSELDALILENSLIKQMRPKYNILLRDDKTYPYICCDLKEAYPRFEITRKVKKDPLTKYYGPYASGAKDLLEALYLCYPLRQMKSCKKRCIFYDMSRCLAPCEFSVKDEYENILKQALQALKNPKQMLQTLNEKMFRYADNENYEEAAKIRDMINHIKNLNQEIEVDLAKDVSFDVFAITNNNEFLSSTRLVINHGKVISVINEKISNKEGDFLTQLILANYKEGIIPINIYIENHNENIELLEEYLSNLANHKVNIKIAKTLEIKKLIQLAKNNALINLEKTENNIANKLKSFFNLSNAPYNIEVFDNSHFQGQAIIGALISYDVFSNSFNKNNYKRFNLTSNNDYEQMREMLTRRINSFDKSVCPDLWIIDGGKALLDLANELLAQNEINLDVIAISKEKLNHLAHRAKGAARDKIHFKDKEFNLKTSDEILQFIQKLRDEAHRFAITCHQNAKRKQDIKSSKLEQIGISKASIVKLLKYFENYENIYNASYDEIAKVTNKNVATKISQIIK